MERRHKITVEEIREFLGRENWRVIASSAGNDSRKTLTINTAGWLQVIDHGKIKYSGKELDAAVTAYNDCN